MLLDSPFIVPYRQSRQNRCIANSHSSPPSAAKAHGRGIGIDAVVGELGSRFSRKSCKSQAAS
ncbi:MAG: hypothetical protein KME16_20140 [Scytolyngbya sp. HA4215-MV1]|nr:hypothetical protein [Scytolyngbya sp. HA4215-MV1]